MHDVENCQPIIHRFSLKYIQNSWRYLPACDKEHPCVPFYTEIQSPAKHANLRKIISEMLCLWPERNTFKSLKPINFPLYKEIIKDPIALDCIIERLDMNSPDQVKQIVYWDFTI